MLAPTTFEVWRHWPVPVQLGLGALVGGVLLTTIGTAQWLELRRHVPNAGRWVGASALAWALDLGVFSAVSTPLWQPGQTTALIIAIGLLGGAAMAVTMATTTGLVLRRLLAAPTASQYRRPPAPTRSVATGTIR